MKKVLVLITAFMIIFSSLVYAGGDKNRGGKGQGSTGTNGGGATTQTRGNQITTQFVYIERQSYSALPFPFLTQYIVQGFERAGKTVPMWIYAGNEH